MQFPLPNIFSNWKGRPSGRTSITALFLILYPFLLAVADEPCGIPWGGNWTPVSNCVITSTTGVDGGQLTLNTGINLNVQSTFIRNSGQPINVSGGTITIGSGGKIVKGNIYITDADGDLYTPESHTSQTSAGVGYTLRRNILGVDCDDGNAGVTFANTTFYQDADGDSFGNPSVSTVACTAPSGYVLDNTDCCDTDANAFPGQTAYFSAPTACGGYDYNCNGSTTKNDSSYTNVSACTSNTFGICIGGGSGCQASVCTKNTNNASTPACGSSYVDYTSNICRGRLQCGFCGAYYSTCDFVGAGSGRTVSCN